jgi:hypothetical protein
MSSPNQDRLNSWKEIAAHLGRDVRTVRRWEKERKLPVHRPPGDARSAVYAFRSEIDAWLSSTPGLPSENRDVPSGLPQVFGVRVATGSTMESVIGFGHPKIHLPAALASGHLRGRWLAIIELLALILATLAAVWALHTLGGSEGVGSVTISGQQLLAWGNGKVVWSYDFGQRVRDLDPEELGDKVRIEDLFGDGNKEIVVAAPLLQTEQGGVSSDGLYCFTAKGKLLWRREFRELVHFGGEDSGPQWEVAKLFVVGEGTGKQIWFSICSYPKSVSVVISADGRGKLTRHFVNYGHLRTISEVTGSKGRFIEAGGINNEYDSAALAVLSESVASGHSPETASLSACEGCPTGEPFRYVLFPRTEVNRVLGPAYNDVRRFLSSGSEFEVMTGEAPGPGLRDWALYSFSADFAPVGVILSDNYWEDHRRLIAEGRIGHSLEACPERLKPIVVRVWSPEGGWSKVELPQLAKAAKRGN